MSRSTLRFEPQAHRTTFSLEAVAPLPESIVEVELGYANITDLYLGSDPPRPEELSSALSVFELHLDDVLRELNTDRSPDDGRSAFDMAVRDGTVVGVGPIFQQLALVEIGNVVDDVDGFELTRDAVEDVFRTIATESLADRAYNPGLDRKWAHLIVGGTCLVVEAYRCWDIDRVVVDSGGR